MNLNSSSIGGLLHNQEDIEKRLTMAENALNQHMNYTSRTTLQHLLDSGAITSDQAERFAHILERLTLCESALFLQNQAQVGSVTLTHDLPLEKRLMNIEAELFRIAKATTTQSVPHNPSKGQDPSIAESGSFNKAATPSFETHVSRPLNKYQLFLQRSAQEQRASVTPAAKESTKFQGEHILKQPIPVPIVMEAYATKQAREPVGEGRLDKKEFVHQLQNAAPSPRASSKESMESKERDDKGANDGLSVSYGILGKVDSTTKAPVSMTVDSECEAAFKDLKVRRKHRFIFYGIHDDKIRTLKLGEKKASFEEFLKELPDAECRYVLYDHEYRTNDGRLSDKLLFIMWSPRAAPTISKMLYTTERPKVASWITGALELTATSRGDIREYLGLDAGSDEDVEENDGTWLDD